MSHNLNSKQRKLLERIVKATAEHGFLHVDEKEAAPLVAAGLIEVNPSMKDEVDNVAARAIMAQQSNDNQAGANEAAPNTNTEGTQAMTAQSPAATPAKTGFTIASVALPAAKRGGRQGETYPFDQLEIGQSFFVPATADRDNPAKSLASTVTSANERYSEVVAGEFRVNRKGREVPVTKQLRTFSIRSVEDGAPWGHPGVKGAAIGRVA